MTTTTKHDAPGETGQESTRPGSTQPVAHPPVDPHDVATLRTLYMLYHDEHGMETCELGDEQGREELTCFGNYEDAVGHRGQDKEYKWFGSRILALDISSARFVSGEPTSAPEATSEEELHGGTVPGQPAAVVEGYMICDVDGNPTDGELSGMKDWGTVLKAILDRRGAQLMYIEVIDGIDDFDDCWVVRRVRVQVLEVARGVRETEDGGTSSVTLPHGLPVTSTATRDAEEPMSPIARRPKEVHPTTLYGLRCCDGSNAWFSGCESEMLDGGPDITYVPTFKSEADARKYLLASGFTEAVPGSKTNDGAYTIMPLVVARTNGETPKRPETSDADEPVVSVSAM